MACSKRSGLSTSTQCTRNASSSSSSSLQPQLHRRFERWLQGHGGPRYVSEAGRGPCAACTCACTPFLNFECVHAPCACIAVTTAIICTLPKPAPQCCGYNRSACAFLYNHVCHARYASRRTPTTTPTTMQRRAADKRGTCEGRPMLCEDRNILATKGCELVAAMRIAADSNIARRIYGLLANGIHFSTQTTKMVPWLSYA